MSIKIDGPVMLVPVDEDEPETTTGAEAVWVFLGFLLLLGVLGLR